MSTVVVACKVTMWETDWGTDNWISATGISGLGVVVRIESHIPWANFNTMQSIVLFPESQMSWAANLDPSLVIIKTLGVWENLVMVIVDLQVITVHHWVRDIPWVLAIRVA
jgi:hypothetical protein